MYERKYQDSSNSNYVSAKELNLSFDFQVHKFGWQSLWIEVKGPLRDLNELSETKYFEFFYEDLYYYLHKNKHLPKWEFSKIYLSGIDSLKLTRDKLESFKNSWLTVSNFDTYIEEK
ncbi:hypothetical protein ACA758_00305 [Mycoplasmopsis agassizii]|uniref:hypothetical protein n=1 Tax=Mycoplasmopsis agassizii TaxID=33922 RepID=UPI003526E442